MLFVNDRAHAVIFFNIDLESQKQQINRIQREYIYI